MGTFAWRPIADTGATRWVRLPLRLPPPLARAAALLAASLLPLVATAAAAAVQYLVLPHPSIAPFVFFFPAVAIVAWRSGHGAGLVTVLSSAITANSLFIPPFGAPKLSGGELLATLLFVAGASPIALLCGALRQRLIAAHRASAQLAEQAALLERSAADAREAEARFRRLADSMPQLVWTAGSDGGVEYYNQRSAAYAGLERAADGSWTWRPAVHPEDADRTLAAWAAAVATGQVYEVEHRVQMADGTYRWHLSRGVPIRSEQGRLLRWYGTATDIHEQKRVTEALAQSDRRKSEFLGVLSHELRNPLAPIRNSLYVLARSAPGSEQHRRGMAVIERQVAQLHRLVDDLLDVTRITRGKIHIARTRVDLVQLARHVLDDQQAQFHRNGIDLALRAEVEELHVLADEARLAQVVGNLLQNAAKFSPRGARATVTVRRADDLMAELSVEDTGRGIPPEVLPGLFEPFVQAEQSLDRSMGGLGLGLALVKGLVELQGGTVTAHSAGAGQGACFTVKIPLERRRRPRPAAAALPAAASPARRVLVIEDNADAAVTLQEALALEGHAVEVAFTGAEGVDRARASRPDVIVCDIGLPGMNGFEVARTLRADPALVSTTLIALSGYALADDVEKARAAGFDLHLPKPADVGELQRSIAGAAGAGAAGAAPAGSA
jgi:PAS domain S-box-containing protein